MSRLSFLIEQAREGLNFFEPLPQSRWESIATKCGPEEVAEIEQRIASLKEDLPTVEEWDGDTMDDLNIAISQFSQLLKLATAT